MFRKNNNRIKCKLYDFFSQDPFLKCPNKNTTNNTVKASG